MTIPSDDQVFESFVPVYDTVPENWEEARQFLIEHLKKISNAINAREIGFFLDEELLSGKQFIPSVPTAGSPQQFRSVLRKVIDFGALPNAAAKAVPHGINVNANFTLVQMYGAASDPVALVYTEIPATDLTALANQMVLFMTATDVVIGTGVNRANFTRCFVTIEYIQEV